MSAAANADEAGPVSKVIFAAGIGCLAVGAAWGSSRDTDDRDDPALDDREVTVRGE